MTLTLKLEPDLERRLKREAERTGLGVREYAVRLFEEMLPAGGSYQAPPGEPLAGEQPPRASALESDPLTAMAGVDDFEPVSVDEVVYR